MAKMMNFFLTYNEGIKIPLHMLKVMTFSLHLSKEIKLSLHTRDVRNELLIVL